ncbi:DUF3551 domain-containing protein [Bradyrhizobium sp. RDI18]|uniref:DUF3551 domain-containing protein n=1 Tax=Bradyrhizobium sp. RDI18 TaxID=3367400 RepID=UPI00371BF5D4
MSKAPPSSHDGAEMIRVSLTALLAAAGIWMIGHIPASAQTGISQYPFCIQGMDNPGWSGCSFNSLEACQASASGTDAECLTNPWYRPGTNPAPPSPQERTGMGGPLPIGSPPR